MAGPEMTAESRAVPEAAARAVGDRLGVDWGVVQPDWWRRALGVELEHGSRLGWRTNVTGDDLEKTGRIALAHLVEFPDYYERLDRLEREADAHWAGRARPSPFRPGADGARAALCRGVLVALLTVATVLLIAILVHYLAVHFAGRSRFGVTPAAVRSAAAPARADAAPPRPPSIPAPAYPWFLDGEGRLCSVNDRDDP
jgi:hypothetical protein